MLLTVLHELTHAFQLEPQGIGPYGGPNKAVWELIEGMADALVPGHTVDTLWHEYQVAVGDIRDAR